MPKNPLLRKIEKVMDCEWLYERLSPSYCHNHGRPGTEPVVLIRMVLIQHPFGIPSLRQTHGEIHTAGFGGMACRMRFRTWQR